MQIDAERYAREKNFMGEFWLFRKKYGTPEGSKEEDSQYWRDLMGEWDRLAGLCDNDIYCLALVMVCYIDLESRYRKMFGTPNYDETLTFFNEVAKHLNKKVLRQVGVNMEFKRVM